LAASKDVKVLQRLCQNVSTDNQTVRGNEPGSLVTETLKNGILIPIVTSKESHFNADFKYLSFIKISFTHQKLRA